MKITRKWLQTKFFWGKWRETMPVSLLFPVHKDMRHPIAAYITAEHTRCIERHRNVSVPVHGDEATVAPQPGNDIQNNGIGGLPEAQAFVLDQVTDSLGSQGA